MTAITGDILIGTHTQTGNTRSIYGIDPTSGERLEPGFFAAGPAEIDQACALAEEAFDVYRNLPLETRAQFLEKIAANILELGPVLIERAHTETGLPIARLEGERGRTVGQLRLFAGVVRGGEWQDIRIEPAQADRKPLPRPDLRLREIALGPVAVFGASNFPLAFSVAGGDTASALAAGCPVVVKGHPAHPGTGELIGRAIQAAVIELNLPAGVFSLLPGVTETGVALVKDPRIKAVGFTGSRSGGLALLKLANDRPEPIPVYAEMSSINPVFLLPGALEARAEAIAAGFVSSLTMGAGQFCTNPGLVLAIDGPGFDAFVAHAASLLPSQIAAPMLTPGIHETYVRETRALAKQLGVQTIARGQAGTGVNRCEAGLFLVDARTFLANSNLDQEIFGSSSLIIRCENQEQMHSIASRLEGQLTATLQIEPEDADIVRSLLPLLERKVGRILANGWPTGVEVSPAMVHGGPFPATSDTRSTSVGTLAIRRFLRPVSYQDIPNDLLPEVLQTQP